MLTTVAFPFNIANCWQPLKNAIERWSVKSRSLETVVHVTLYSIFIDNVSSGEQYLSTNRLALFTFKYFLKEGDSEKYSQASFIMEHIKLE